MSGIATFLELGPATALLLPENGANFRIAHNYRPMFCIEHLLEGDGSIILFRSRCLIPDGNRLFKPIRTALARPLYLRVFHEIRERSADR